MTWQELLLYVPAVVFIAGAWLVAWRVSRTGTGAAQDAPQRPEAPAREKALADR